MKDYLQNYAQTIYPFHMPGHKLGRISPLGLSDLYRLDVTEVEGTDNLHHPEGIIKIATERARRLYGADHTFFLVNGSSCGILSAVSACCKQDGKILVARNSHKSIYHSITINRLDPIYVYPEYIKNYGLLGGIKPEEILRAFQENPDISCVVITSPTYEGFTSDIKSIANIVHHYGKVLIVDEAHGAHFKFHTDFPKTALDCDADLVIQSVHKTLPALTQSALLHVNGSRVDLNRLKEYLAIYQTSSPSYILMAGIDSCMEWIEREGEEAFSSFIENLNVFRKKMTSLKNMKLVGPEIIGTYGVYDIDVTKLVLIGKDTGIFGKEIETLLREKYKIQVEMSTLESILAISTVADQTEAFDKLFEAFYEIDLKNDCINYEKFDIMNPSTKLLRPYDAFQMEKESVPFDQALDRVCGQFVTLYPPGIPLLIPGEVITVEIMHTLTLYLQGELTVIGLDGHQISVIK